MRQEGTGLLRIREQSQLVFFYDNIYVIFLMPEGYVFGSQKVFFHTNDADNDSGWISGLVHRGPFSLFRNETIVVYNTNSGAEPSCHLGHCFRGKIFSTDPVSRSGTLRGLHLQGRRSAGLGFQQFEAKLTLWRGGRGARQKLFALICTLY